MSEWSSYGLSDFLLFSPETYWRLVERHNREVWPFHLLMVAAGATMARGGLAAKGLAGRAALGVLAALWLWVGWSFHWQRYAKINWAAEYLAAAFALQSVLLAAATLRPRDPGQPTGLGRIIGWVLAATGVLAYPVFAVVAGRPWSQAEVFGIMPEPTALATLGLLLLTRQRHWVGLSIIPSLSLLVGLATAWLVRAN